MIEIIDEGIMTAIRGLLLILIVEIGLIIKALGVRARSYLDEKKNALTTQTLADYMMMLDGIVVDAVQEAEQTQVKKMKSDGSDNLSPTEQEVVKDTVFKKVRSNTPDKVIETFEANGQSFSHLVDTLIERTVYKINQKKCLEDR